jgi:hypothetical protein
MQLEFEQPVAHGHRHRSAVEGVGHRAGEVVEPGLENRLDRRSDVAAVIGQHGCAGADPGEACRCGGVDAEAVVKAPGTQPMANRGQFGMGAGVGILGENTAIRRQRPRDLVEPPA